MSNWHEEKEQKRKDRELKQQMRAMATPISRGESVNVFLELQNQTMSLGLAMEALDTLLIAKGVLVDNELMDKMKELAAAKKAQAEAAQVAPESSIITAV